MESLCVHHWPFRFDTQVYIAHALGPLTEGSWYPSSKAQDSSLLAWWLAICGSLSCKPHLASQPWYGFQWHFLDYFFVTDLTIQEYQCRKWIEKTIHSKRKSNLQLENRLKILKMEIIHIRILYIQNNIHSLNYYY